MNCLKKWWPLLALQALALVSCSEPAQQPASSKPSFYTNLAESGAQLDERSALSLINGYRQNLGLKALVLDPALVEQAHTKALAHGANGSIGDGSKLASKDRSGAGEIVSAGYYTMSDAYSGWRSSPAHDATLRLKTASRLGIAATYAPGTKYKVYWVVMVAK